MIGLMKTTATNICIEIGLMKLQLQIFVYDRVDETNATNVNTGQG